MKNLVFDKDGELCLRSGKRVEVKEVVGQQFIYGRSGQCLSRDVHAQARARNKRDADGYLVSGSPYVLKDIDNHSGVEYEHSGHHVVFVEFMEIDNSPDAFWDSEGQ